jgi:hypothetical protein
VCTGVYCNSCKKAADRRSMDEENRKINPKFKCKVCDEGWYSPAVKNPSMGIIKAKKV